MRSLGFLAAVVLLSTACAGIAQPAAQLNASLAPPASAGSVAARTPAPTAAADAAVSPAASPSGESSAPTAPPTAVSTPTTQPVPTPTAQQVATPSPVPSATRTPAPVTTLRTSTYTTLPPGSVLPTDQQCADAIAREPWEPRPDNRAANLSNAWSNGFRLSGSYLASIATGYEQRVTGNFSGTTDQILRWGACKWGFDENDVRAQAVIESYWRQSLMSDCNTRSQPETNGCASVGLFSVKGANIPATHPGTWPAAMTSTAFNVDYALAVRRLCYEGKETWLRQFNATYAAGDLWGCIGKWYSGRWHDAGAETYIARVRATLSARTWLSASF